MATAPRKTSRRNRKVIGRIDPDSVYTTEGCMRYAGLGNVELAEGRQAGVLHPSHQGRRTYYMGYELIAWCMRNRKTGNIERMTSVAN